MRAARIFYGDDFCAILRESDAGYTFQYDESYLAKKKSRAVSLTLPLRAEVYESRTLFAFFDGLIPEGWLLSIVAENWKINRKDRFALLLAACGDCIGAVSVREVEDE